MTREFHKEHSHSSAFANIQQTIECFGFYFICCVACKLKVCIALLQLKDIHHDHLTRFIGACVEGPNCCLVTEYCPRGSLQDILEDDAITLDWDFRYSLLHDMVKVTSYVYSLLINVRQAGRL